MKLKPNIVMVSDRKPRSLTFKFAHASIVVRLNAGQTDVFDMFMANSVSGTIQLFDDSRYDEDDEDRRNPAIILHITDEHVNENNTTERSIGIAISDSDTVMWALLEKTQ